MQLDIKPEVRESILDQIVPTKEEVKLQTTIIDRLKNSLQERAERLDVHYSFIEPEGSTGRKQTQLKNNADIDLFVGLNPADYDEILSLNEDDRNRRLSRILNSMVDEWFRPVMEELSAKRIQKAYSQHPYLTGVIDGIDIDIVFCFDLTKEQIAQHGTITAVDRTQHHTNYVAERLDDDLRQDARILKSFIQAGHAYGDKCAVGRMGITGFTIEILTILTGGLGHALERFLSLKENPIDPLGRTSEELKKIQSFQDDYLIIIDPTDTNRNAASSFDPRTVEWTNLRIRQLFSIIESADQEEAVNSFIEKPIPSTPLPSRISKHAHAFEFEAKKGVHYTVLRDQLYSLGNRITLMLEREKTGERRFGRSLFEVYFEDPIYSIAFMVESPKVSEEYRRKGPPVHLEQAVQNFKSKHNTVRVKDGYVWTMEQREYTLAIDLIEAFLSEDIPEGLEQLPEIGVVSRKNLNILYKCIMQMETDFAFGSDK